MSTTSTPVPPALGTGPALPSPPRRFVHELVLETAAHHPSAPAVTGPDRSLTYGELAAEAERLAQRLLRSGCVPGNRVAVACRPSAEMIVAVLAVLHCGAAYVPVDLALPAERAARILADADVSAVVADDGAATLALALPALGASDPSDSAPSLRVVPVGGAQQSATPGAAYVIYTSGSTGEPKGVVVGHEQLAASTQARALIYPGTATFLLVSPLAFDSSVAGIWSTLSSGGHLVVAGRDDIRDVHRLAALIDRHRAARLLCIPSLYAQLLAAAPNAPEALRSLRSVVVAGEPLPAALVERHFAVHGPPGESLDGRPPELVNEYGPTEATVFASYHRFTTVEPVTIGHPVPGARLYVLDEAGHRLGTGTEGELYIGGAGVAQGYLGRPEATARSFLPDPFAAGQGARMFRTGDVVRWNDDGTLSFIGRRDHQVKIRGHRVELEAAEEELRRLPGVEDAVVLPEAGHTRLVAFVTTTGEISESAVRTQLSARVAPVMVPTRVHTVARFPLTPNGKVDRRRLATMGDQNVLDAPLSPVDEAAAPGTGDTGSRVAASWAQVLGRTPIPLETNFFDLGGHSLTMFELQEALERHTGVRPPIVALFRHTTVTEQANLIDSLHAAGPQDTSAEPAPEAAARAVRAGRRLRARRAGTA
ncbi:non-ribosomal peptide synthetase [Streptomyces diastaticus]|uniref:non-ribosomal peptide synthetase n=1 Tax=Streptomyces diastaticus TaxID=1956 RepID=UPI00364FE35C